MFIVLQTESRLAADVAFQLWDGSVHVRLLL